MSKKQYALVLILTVVFGASERVSIAESEDVFPVTATSFTGKVVSVTDGDTIKVMRSGEVVIEKLFYLLFGIIFSAILAHFLHKNRDAQIRESLRIEIAKNNLEFAFIETLILLEVKPPADPSISNEWQNTGKLLKRFYEKHRLAIWRFEGSLPKSKRSCFRNIWNEYCCYDEETHEATYSDYENEGTEQESGKRQLAISRINKLISFIP